MFAIVCDKSNISRLGSVSGRPDRDVMQVWDKSNVCRLGNMSGKSVKDRNGL